jgi:F-box/leucine-rich repeat protein 14
VTDKQVLALSNLTGLAVLNLRCCRTVTAEGLRALSSLTALTTLTLHGCDSNVTDEVLRSLSSLTALSTLGLRGCDNVTAAGKQALRTAIPNLTIIG